ncbi:hypothetical protein [uncultured Psychroserpens sp.]|uniref:hypothetical protein n=1 Tax=uncultured Psychroserpens sp. TaxID=255436 RepID=UPI00261ED541|nr:hypothetical protein [uncultured Psychroserpens sp.]
MGSIVGLLIQIITFPGIIFDQFANKIVCNLLDIEVHEVKYLQFESPAGYVIHDIPESYLKVFLISIGPFFISTLVAILMFVLGYSLDSNDGVLRLVFNWLGISIAAHAFPTSKNGDLLWKQSLMEVKNKNYIALIGFPLVLIIYLARLLHYFWLDVIYGLVLLLLIVEPWFK